MDPEIKRDDGGGGGRPAAKGFQALSLHIGDKVYLVGDDGSHAGPYRIATLPTPQGTCTLCQLDYTTPVNNSEAVDVEDLKKI